MDRLHVVFVSLLVVATALGQECRPGWTYNGDTGSCYAIPTGAEGNWAEAMTYCTSMSSELAVIESAAEQAFLVSLANSTTSLPHDADFWIGAVDVLEESVFIWANRLTQVETYFWGSGEPSGTSPTGVRQSCVRLESELTWAWGDGDCDSTEYFICEKEAEG